MSGPMKDKVSLVMEETGCDRSEAELALQMCAYDLEGAVQAVPRLFQNIVIFKGRFCVQSESLYGLWLGILNLKERRLLRARAVISYNPAVYASELDQHWFDFEGRLYACRLWAGTLQSLSQEVEGLLSSWFASDEAALLYEEGVSLASEAFDPLERLLALRLGGGVAQEVRQDVLDMGQFQAVRSEGDLFGEPHKPKRASRRVSPQAGRGHLLLKVALEPDLEGVLSGELKGGDLVYVSINDKRDIAQYLARLFGAPSAGSFQKRTAEGGTTILEEGQPMLLVPVEAVEMGPTGVGIRVRFSAGVCGDVEIPGDIRVKVERRPVKTPWWKKIFGG